jgi:NADPH:quinone reductase-like Zn-dependent oxidoreductase
VSLTGEQLVQLATQAVAGQAILVAGALGSVGRAAVLTRRLAETEALDVSRTLALGDNDAIARLEAVDGVADTVGGEAAAKLFGKVGSGGRFGCASVLPDGVPAQYPAVGVSRVFARPDASKLGKFADDVRDGKFVLPIS